MVHKTAITKVSGLQCTISQSANSSASRTQPKSLCFKTTGICSGEGSSTLAPAFAQAVLLNRRCHIKPSPPNNNDSSLRLLYNYNLQK